MLFYFVRHWLIQVHMGKWRRNDSTQKTWYGGPNGWVLCSLTKYHRQWMVAFWIDMSTY